MCWKINFGKTVERGRLSIYQIIQKIEISAH